MNVEKIKELEFSIINGRLENGLFEVTDERETRFKLAYKQLSARFAGLKRQRMMDTIDNESYNRGVAKITESFLWYLSLENKPIHRLPLTLLMKTFWPQLTIASLLLVGVIFYVNYQDFQPKKFPDYFSGYIHNMQSSNPIADAKIRLFDTEGKELSIGDRSSDSKGFWIIKSEVLLNENFVIEIFCESCEEKVNKFKLRDLQELKSPDYVIPTFKIKLPG